MMSRSKELLSIFMLWIIFLLSIKAVNGIKRTEYIAKQCGDILCGFEHLEIDLENSQNKLYLGGVNRLFQLNSNLEVEKTVITGPIKDSDQCFPRSECENPTVDTDNFNKLLKIDNENRRIVVCGSVQQGICDLRQLGNISKTLNNFTNVEDYRSNDYVASTRQDQSTVGFIAKEGTGKNEFSLFVGSSKTAQDSSLIVDDELFLTYSSRRMPRDNMDVNMFSSDLESQKDNSVILGLLMKKSYSQQNFRVDFVSAFEGINNGYFVLNYPTVVDDVVVPDDVRAYVAQVCLRVSSKSTKNSFFEIPISAVSYLDETPKNLYKVKASTAAKVGSDLEHSLEIRYTHTRPNKDVLFASFESKDEAGSTVAIFPLYELDQMYSRMLSSCVRGQRMNHVNWQRENELPCTEIQYQSKEPVCDNSDIWDVRGLLKSDETIQGYTIYESKDTVVTSIAVTKLGVHTVVFMGTQDGHLMKLRLDSKPVGNRLSQPYEKLVIDSRADSSKWSNMGSPEILSGMRFDNELTRLYVMSERRLVALPLHDCTKYTTCSDCLAPGDPFCGWCTLENRCTAADQCPQDNMKYATSSPSRCPKLSRVQPEALSVTEPTQNLRITIENIPAPSQRGQYYCNFRGKSETQAKYKDAYIECLSPSDVPQLNGEEVSVPLTLIHKDNKGRKNVIASTEVVFYKCSNFKSCLPCVSSDKFNCQWYIKDNQCKSTGNGGTRDVRSAEECPQLVGVAAPLYLHVNQTRKFKVEASNLPSIGGTTDQGFKCQFSIGEKVVTVDALHTSSTIVCNAIQGFLPNEPGVYETKAHINVLWKNDFMIDNPNSLNVTMYQCQRGNDDNCGKCILLSKELKCGWCEVASKCVLCENCQGSTCNGPDDFEDVYRGWLDKSQICKHPKILNFTPKATAPGGTTKVTITGINLGTKVKLERGITIAGEECTVLSEGYKESESVVCEVRNVSGEKKKPIRLCVRPKPFLENKCESDDYLTESTEGFEFVVPKLKKFEPERGLYLGGTIITLYGSSLNVGNSVTVRIGSRPCIVHGKATNSSLICKLACESPQRARRHARNADFFSRMSRKHGFHHDRRRYRRAEEQHRVEIMFDGSQRYYKNSFKMESTVSAKSMTPKESIASGGMPINITGENLDLAQEIILRVSLKGFTKERACRKASASKAALKTIHCLSPDISEKFDGNYSAQLILDECTILPLDNIRYTKDPYLEKFEGKDQIKEYQSGPIIIPGIHLCPNPIKCDQSTARVDIGDSMTCNIISLDKDKLVCRPPEGDGQTHVVKVYIGDYEQEVGSLKFASQTAPFPFIIVVIVIAIIVVLLVVVVYVCRRRNNQNIETVRQLQMQRDMIEAKVAKECKEAFAELQTDMQSDFDNLGTVGIPFRPRTDYIMRVLFPDPDMFDKLNQTMHSTYDKFLNYQNGRGVQFRSGCQAMENFDKLLENKRFLLLFISTLEQQRKFTMKDKSNVAGLLMIVLQNRLRYATEILEELLSELIRTNMESKSNPKLLLRRTESVAEKMLTHWFSILLHGFLGECAGEPLFMLYRAIKAQLDKGPIDAMTGDAKYSLSEDKLLRQTVQYEVLTLLVMENDAGDGSSGTRPMSVKVLDCDTISQTKGKIIAVKFKHLPQSQHPDPDDFDLEIQQESLGRVILNDEDSTSIVEGLWKRINTLLHYKVKDRTLCVMVPKKIVFNQSMNSNHSFGARVGGMRYNGSGHRLISDGAGSLPRYMTNAPSSRSTTPTIIEDGKKLYHLTKQHDAEPKDGEGEVTNKMASEIYLTRLLATKGTIQKFVDDLFETIFSVVQRGHSLPHAIRHMFEFLDEQASYHGVTDPDVVHTWKSNSLPLRFWVNLIKNPQFLFDINKTPLVDSCLTVIGQTFMDSCSKSEHILGKDSPSNKLLYAKDIPNYKMWVERYYTEISNMEPLNPEDLKIFLDDESRNYRNNPSSQAALSQLYLYVQNYNQEIVSVLNDDDLARSQRLAQQLDQISTTMTSTV